MANNQDLKLPPPERDWKFVVSAPATCKTGPLPYPLIARDPKPIDRLPAGGKSWQLTMTRYAVISKDTEKEEDSTEDGGDGIGPFENGRLVLEKLDELSTSGPGEYYYQAIFSLVDEKDGMIRHVVVKTHPFNTKDDFDNTKIRLSKMTWFVLHLILLMPSL